MTAENPTPPSGYDEAEFGNQNDDEDVETVDLEPGDVLEGTVVSLQDGENENGDWYKLRINTEERGVCDYFAKGDVKQACREGRVRVGRDIWVAMMHEEESFTDDDGEKRTYNPTKVAFPGGDD